MANEIRLKRGSGSDPGASDLVTGEIAVRTDTGKLFTKKDDGTVAEISGGGIDDGDKGDITVSSSGAVFTIDNGVVTSAKIADGTIVTADLADSAVSTAKIANGAVSNAKIVDGAINNAKVVSDAAIAGSKIDPDFGSQNIVTTGTLGSGNFSLTSTQPRIRLIDSSDNPDYSILNEDGILNLYDDTNSASRFTIDAGKIVSKLNHDFDAGIDVTGDITGTGNFTLTSTDTGSSAAPELELYRNSASPADADYLGQLKFTGESDDGSKEVYAKITGKIDDASSGTEDGIIEIAHRKAGSNVITARFKSTELQLLNGTNLDVDGTCTATTFSGSGASLTNLPAPDLTALTQHVRTNQQVGIGDSNGFDVALSNTGVGGFLTCNSGNISIKTASTNDDVKLLVSDDEGVFLDGADDAFKPITNNVVDLGSTSLKYKNVYAAAYYGDGSNLTGISAGATGGGRDEIFYENSQAVTTDYTITSGKNAMSAGPITINNGVSVTVPSGSTYTIV